MESDELRFKHVGLSSDSAVIFCQMDNGKTYAMPLSALEQAEDWNPKAKPKAVNIIHDGYAALVQLNTGVEIDFPSDFVLNICEPSYTYYKDKSRTISGVGARIRAIRQSRGLTLDALAAKSGIAKPNLSRLENDKVTPKYDTIRTIAAALDTHPALLVEKDAWTWTQHEFTEWKLGLRWNAVEGKTPTEVGIVELVNVFLRIRPEHGYARKKLYAMYAPRDPKPDLDAEKWAGELNVAKVAQERAKSRKVLTAKKELARLRD